MGDIIGVIAGMAICSAFGMGIAWFYILEAKLDRETRDRLEMIDFYSKRNREDQLEIWILKRQLADLKGEKFDEPKPTLEYERYPWRE